MDTDGIFRYLIRAHRCLSVVDCLFHCLDFAFPAMLKAHRMQNESKPNSDAKEEIVLKETSPIYGDASDGDIDLLLPKDSLAKTPWERMQANDDALNFDESLRAAIEKRNAKPK